MKEEYNFTNARRNPYVKKEKQQITINLDSEVIAYFKVQSGNSGIPYQTLINLYLSDCVSKKRELQMSWE
ncbi:MAG: BrnA antitoxin family protein [Faecalimonas sp.]|nr:BrnA antitoxin family protein [Faecalimonas sp.]